MFCQPHQLGHLWMNHAFSHLLYTRSKHNYQNTLKKKTEKKKKKKVEKKWLTVVHKTHSIAKISNISIYVHLHATEKCTSRRVPWDFFAQVLKHNLWNHKHIYIYMTNKLVTITQSCLGAYLYSAGTQYRNLLKKFKLLVMTSMVICHQKHKGHINTELKYTHKSHW